MSIIGVKFSQLPAAAPGVSDQVVGLASGNLAALFSVGQLGGGGATPTVRQLNLQTTDYTLQPSDLGGVVLMAVSIANTITVPAAIMPIGAEVDIMQIGPGVTTIVAGTGAMIQSASNSRQILGQFYGCTLLQIDNNVWTLAGALNL